MFLSGIDPTAAVVAAFLGGLSVAAVIFLAVLASARR